MKSTKQRQKQKKLSLSSTLTLTPRQLQILRLIKNYRDSNGCSPTMQELATTLQVNKVTVFEHVEILVQKGLLHRVPNKARSLTLDPQCDLFGADDPDTTDQPGQFPLLGRIVAGEPLETFNTSETLDVTAMFRSPHDTFALEVHGDSMIDEQIRDGDVVIVEKTNIAHNGQIVVALLDDGETTLKTLHKQGNQCRLIPANPKYKPIVPKHLNIQGVVIGVLRKY